MTKEEFFKKAAPFPIRRLRNIHDEDQLQEAEVVSDFADCLILAAAARRHVSLHSLMGKYKVKSTFHSLSVS